MISLAHSHTIAQIKSLVHARILIHFLNRSLTQLVWHFVILAVVVVVVDVYPINVCMCICVCTYLPKAISGLGCHIAVCQNGCRSTTAEIELDIKFLSMIYRPPNVWCCKRIRYWYDIHFVFLKFRFQDTYRIIVRNTDKGRTWTRRRRWQLVSESKEVSIF